MEKEKNDKKIIKKIIIAGLLVFIVFAVANYVTNENARSYIDTYIFRKELSENKTKAIEINSDDNCDIYAYSKFISVFSKNELKIYDSSANNIKTLNIEISKPIKSSEGKFLVIAENEGKTLYLINDLSLVWKNDVEGSIYQVNVNENGYTSAIVKNNTYKSIIYVYKPDGTLLFKKYISSGLAVQTDISKDNKFLIIGKSDYSGVSINSFIELISIENAIKDSQNSVEKKYESEQGKILVDLKFTKNNEIIAKYTDSVIKYSNDEQNTVFEVTDDCIFFDINLRNYVVAFSKESSGLFSFEYKTLIKDIETGKENIYVLNSNIPKKVITNKSVVGMIFGTEVKVLNTNAWLLKDYKSSKQIKDIVLGTNIAGVIYKDKIEIVSF